MEEDSNTAKKILPADKKEEVLSSVRLSREDISFVALSDCRPNQET